MKTKEKLERAGWVYLFTFGSQVELFARNEIRLLFDTKTDEPICFYRTYQEGYRTMTPIGELQLEVFCKKL